MQNNPTVSFVLPCFNSEMYLQETLDSLRLQTNTDWECVAIDDGSSDGTLAILLAMAARDARFSVISRENCGLITSLNEGVAAAKGEWIARIDADDVCAPQRLEKQLAYVQTHGLDVCGSWVRFIGEREGEWHTPVAHEAIRAGLLFNTPLAHPTILARRSLLLANPYPADAPHAEDYALWCQLAAAGAKFGNVPECLLSYRTHPGQITQAKKAALRITAQRIREEYARCVLPEALQAEAARFAELAEPGRIINREEWHWMRDFLTQLVALWPQSREALGTVWLDTLQRTRGVKFTDLPGVGRLLLQLPPPASEKSRLKRQAVRLIVSDWLWRKVKR